MAEVKISAKAKKDIAERAAKANKKDLNNRFQKKFEKIKNEMIEEFLNHPVTIEILAGPDNKDQRVSGTLNRKTNLFAFIGFSSSDKPIEPILNVLNSTEYKKTAKGFAIIIPTAKDIFAVTPMPWAPGRSWAKGIEQGIPGLGKLLNIKKPYSRSGEAIQQDKRKIRSDKFQNVPYISYLINKYKKEFKKIK